MSLTIYSGKIHHTRYDVAEHSFSYPVFYFAVNLQSLSALNTLWPLSAYNKAAVYSIASRDYLNEGEGSFEEKLLSVYRGKGIEVLPAEIHLVSVPRFLGYVFNPVSFYICFNADRSFHSMVAEVNNTFGEKHLYLLQEFSQAALPATFNFTKEFFVSPFFDREGEYTLTLKSFGEVMDISITLSDKGKKLFWAGLECVGKPLTGIALISAMVCYPITLMGTMMRIQVQAYILYARKLVRPFAKPPPMSLNTVRSKQGIVHRIRLWCLLKFFSAKPFPSDKKS
jgi:DUF1365 family protein